MPQAKPEITFLWLFSCLVLNAKGPSTKALRLDNTDRIWYPDLPISRNCFVMFLIYYFFFICIRVWIRLPTTSPACSLHNRNACLLYFSLTMNFPRAAKKNSRYPKNTGFDYFFKHPISFVFIFSSSSLWFPSLSQHQQNDVICSTSNVQLFLLHTNFPLLMYPLSWRFT